MPIETLVHHNQANYYRALQESNEGKDCRPFIDFMIDAIGNSLYKYIDIATESTTDAGANVPVNVPVNEVSEKIILILRSNPKATAKKMAFMLGVTDKTIKRHIKTLREQGRLKRVGSDKSGHWEVVERVP